MLEQARIVWLCAMEFVALYFWATALEGFLSSIVLGNGRMPAGSGWPYYLLIARTLSTIAVGFLAFCWIARTLDMASRFRPVQPSLRARTWFAILACVTAGAWILYNLAWFVQKCVVAGGGLSMLEAFFARREAVIFVVYGGAIVYGLLVARPADRAPRRDRVLGWAVAIAVSVTLVYGVSLVNAASAQRLAQEARLTALDERREADVMGLSGAIDSMYFQKHRLPRTLSELEPRSQSLLDPETHVPYDYVRQSASRYTLCATFVTDDRIARAAQSVLGPHIPGRICYSSDAKDYAPGAS